MKKEHLIYEPSFDHTIPSIINFSYEINSLYRYWIFCKDKICSHVDDLENTPKEILSNYEEELKRFQREKAEGIEHDQDTNSFYEVGWTEEELLMDFEDNVSRDKEEFPLYLCHSITGSIVKIFYQMLKNLAEEITERDKHISLKNSKELWDPRTKLIHDINRIVDPELKKDQSDFHAIKAVFKKLNIDMEEVLKSFKENLDNTCDPLEFVEESFDEFVMATQNIEMSSIEFFKET